MHYTNVYKKFRVCKCSSSHFNFDVASSSKKMSINSLPVELLQKILSLLWFDDLKSASLVCRHWNEATAKFIVCKAKFNVTYPIPETYGELDEWDEQDREQDWLGVIRNSIRNYRAIEINANTAMDEWHQLEAAVKECVQRFPTINGLYLREIKSHDLQSFYTTCRDWFTQCDSLHVSIRNCSYMDSEKAEEEITAKEWTLAMHNLTQLSWRECDYDPLRTITIDAPHLETIYLEGREGISPGEVRLKCNRIKHVECQPYEHNFPGMFETGLESVETLQLTLENRIGLKFIGKLHQLQYLDITFLCKMKSLDELVEIGAGLRIKTLKISSSVERSTLDIQSFFENFTSLESLELRRVDFFADGCILARQLEELDLQNVEYCDEFTLNAPSLTKLTLDVDILGKISLINAASLTTVHLIMTTENPFAFEHIVYPFLQIHENVTHLTLAGRHYDDSLDKPTKDCAHMNVQSLELKRMSVTIDFFRMVSEWKSLKSLTLTDCTIDYEGLADGERVQLPSVDSMVLNQVSWPGNDKRTEFPLLPGRVTESPL